MTYIAKTTKTLAVELCNEISKDVQANLAKNVKSMDEIQKNAEKTIHSLNRQVVTFFNDFNLRKKNFFDFGTIQNVLFWTSQVMIIILFGEWVLQKF
ncbi:hypothetical protein FACS1894188_05010 [Clostridia bacterium]|nr:hypothetical protein FACS1894188_05010 [Clostridia bacterium]